MPFVLLFLLPLWLAVAAAAALTPCVCASVAVLLLCCLRSRPAHRWLWCGLARWVEAPCPVSSYLTVLSMVSARVLLHATEPSRALPLSPVVFVRQSLSTHLWGNRLVAMDLSVSGTSTGTAKFGSESPTDFGKRSSSRAGSAGGKADSVLASAVEKSFGISSRGLGSSPAPDGARPVSRSKTGKSKQSVPISAMTPSRGPGGRSHGLTRHQPVFAASFPPTRVCRVLNGRLNPVLQSTLVWFCGKGAHRRRAGQGMDARS